MSISLRSHSFNAVSASQDGDARSLTETFVLKVNVDLNDNQNLLTDTEAGIETFTYGESPENGDFQILFWTEDGANQSTSEERIVEIVTHNTMNSAMVTFKSRSNPDNVLFQEKWERPTPIDDIETATSGKPPSKRVILNIPHNPRPL
ncbi:MAG: hypothetical protein MRZ79_15515 [Bacteroidia bacterium]|nr:hypothetical protein [Bacteroidia bacterium]